MGFEVSGKVALVTGANRGIGRAIVDELLSRGVAKVYAAVRDPGTASDQVAASGGRVTAIQLDLTDDASIRKAAEQAADVQLVINNAGVFRGGDLMQPAIFDSLDFEIEANVKGLLRIAHAFAPVLAKNGGGALVQLNSVASLRGFAGFATYCASKAASYSLTQSLRQALAGQGTLVISVHPGPIATDMAVDAGLADRAEPPAVVAKAIVEALAAERFHVFPDTMAREMGQAYAGFAAEVVEATGMEE